MRVMVFFLCIILSPAYSQLNSLDYYHTDTFKIRYLVWDTDSDRSNPILIQKDGFVVKFHLINPNPIKEQSEREDIDILDNKKKPEVKLCLGYVFL